MSVVPDFEPLVRARVSARRGIRTFLLSITMILVAGVVATPSDEASACAIAYDPADGAPRVAGEEALIVWDPDRGVEHFVRSARFEGVTHAFAFLVPTPGRPELAEADDEVFERLSRIYLRPAPVALERSRGEASRGIASAGAVTVLEERRVAGLDAAVLHASDPDALAAWLRQRRFATRPDLDAWLAPYVARGFFVTAFRYEPASQASITSRAVRLTFPTTAGFYPYAEPASSAPAGSDRGAARTLRLSVIAPFRVSATEGRRAWRARVGYAGQPGGLEHVLAGVVAVTPAMRWMTTFEDRPSRRGRHDLRFEQASQQRAVAPSLRGMIGR